MIVRILNRCVFNSASTKDQSSTRIDRKPILFWEWLLVAIVLALRVVTQWDLWISHQSVVSHDTLRTYPIFAYFADCIQHGVLPLWDPYLESGQPFYLISPGMVYLWQPWTLILIGVGKLANVSLLHLFHYDLLLKFFVFALGCFVLLRRIAQTREAAFLGLAIVTFSSLSISYLAQIGFLHDILLFPWVLYCAFRLFEDCEPKFMVPIAWFLGVAAQSYHIVYMGVFVFIFFACGFLFAALPRSALNVFRVRRHFFWVSALLLAVLSFKLIPEMLSLDRIVLILRKDVPFASSSAWGDLFVSFAPYYYRLRQEFNIPIYSEGLIYVGLMPLFLAAAGIRLSRNRYKLPFVITGACMLLFMFGPRTPIRGILTCIPFARNTTDFHAFLVFCVVVLACMGMDDAMAMVQGGSSRGLQRLKRIFIGSVVISSVAVLSFALGSSNFRAGSSLWFFLHIAFLGSLGNIAWFALGCSVALWSVGTKHAGWFRSVIFISVIGELLCFGPILGDWNVVKTTVLTPGLPIDTLAEHQYRDERIPSIRTTHFWNIPSIRREFTAYHQRSLYGSHFIERTNHVVFESSKSREFMDIAAGVSAPKLRLFRKAVSLTSGQGEAAKNMGFKNFKNTFFLEESLPPELRSWSVPLQEAASVRGLPAGGARVLQFDPNRLIADVLCREDCWLYYSDGYDEAWQVFVDGVEKKIYKANAAFKAVPLRQGRHEVQFVYNPRLYKWSLLVYCVGVVVGAAAIFASL